MCEGDHQGGVLKCSLPEKLVKTRDLELPFVELRWIHPYLSTPILPGGQKVRVFLNRFSEDAMGGGGKKRGEENPHEWHPSQIGVLNPPRTVRFPPPQVSLLYFSSTFCWSRRYAERIWGELFILVRRILGNCRRISQRILMADFDTEFFGLVFPGVQATQKIHAQNLRPELSAFLSNFTFLNPKFIHGDFLLPGETKLCTPPPYHGPRLFGEPVVCTPDSRGFHHCRGSKFLFCPFWRLDCLKRWWAGSGEGRARNGRGTGEAGRGTGEAGRGMGEERARPGEERGSARVREAKEENARVWRVWTRKPGKVKFTMPWFPWFRNTPSTAGNSMTSCERASPEPILKKEASPAVLGGREFWKRSGSLKCLEL